MGDTNAIVLDDEIYKGIVDGIKSSNENVISDSATATTADNAIKKNNVIPDFIKADEDVVKLLHDLKKQVNQVIQTMENVHGNHIDVDKDANNSASKLETNKNDNETDD